MPIDYKKYHPHWHKISRFVRLIRARNCCEHCEIENYTVRLYCDKDVIDTRTGFTNYADARKVADALFVDAHSQAGIGDEQYRATVVILTVAHLDHDIQNNELENLAALCQSCHLKHDRKDNAQRRRYGPKGRFHKQIRINYESTP